MSDDRDKAQQELEQTARELAPEATQEEFLEEFGLGSTCERCGRQGLDDEEYTDCELVADPTDARGPWILLCHDCLRNANVTG